MKNFTPETINNTLWLRGGNNSVDCWDIGIVITLKRVQSQPYYIIPSLKVNNVVTTDPDNSWCEFTFEQILKLVDNRIYLGNVDDLDLGSLMVEKGLVK